MRERETERIRKLEELRDTASEYVREAGRFLFAAARINHVSEKSRQGFVSEVDTTVQEYLKERLEKLLPQAQFMGEEQDNSHIDFEGLYWILDPVDGTTNLIHGFRHSAISLALALGSEIILGIVYDPYVPELFSAIRDRGAFLNGRPIRIEKGKTLSGSLVLVGTTPAHRELSDSAFLRIRRIYDRCRDIRRAGCASLDLCFLAAGRADAYYEEILQPWDYAAGMLIAQEAGAKVTAVDGTPMPLRHGSSIAAADPDLLKELRGVLMQK